MKVMGVSGDAPSRAESGTFRIGRHDANDQSMIAAAKLAFDFALPTEAVGAELLSLPDREVTWVRRLFEKAVGGFYDVVLSPEGWRGRTRYRVGMADRRKDRWYRQNTAYDANRCRAGPC